jgi:5-methylcytosine-specific restriction endonuclease McrA
MKEERRCRMVYPAGMAFYDKREWNTARRQALHDSGYRCQRCGNSLVGLGKACHVHHKKELRRAPALRIEPLNLMSVCRPCHTVLHNEAKRPPAVNVDGTPNDPDHPWFRSTGGTS